MDRIYAKVPEDEAMSEAAPRPVIGVTLDSEQPGGYSKLPWYALRQNYFEAVARAGGVPIALPHEPDLVPDYLVNLGKEDALAGQKFGELKIERSEDGTEISFSVSSRPDDDADEQPLVAQR